MKNLKKIMKNFNMKSGRGITLIALIITIIILVLLAGVSIRTVANYSMVGHAINGTQEYVAKAIEENRILEQTDSTIDSTLASLREIQGENTLVAIQAGERTIQKQHIQVEQEQM